MKVVLLRGAREDLLWFRSYYRKRFSEGAGPAFRHLGRALDRLAEMPLIGRAVPDRPVREYAIARTPFLLIYRVVEDRVEVLRVWDGRAQRVEGWTSDAG